MERISTGVYPNILQVTAWDSKFFVRASDRTQIQPKTTLTAELPLLLEPEDGDFFSELGKILSDAGKMTIIIAFVSNVLT